MSSITININAPELTQAIHALATALSTTNSGRVEIAATTREEKPALIETPEPINTATAQMNPNTSPTITLETVRAKLAALSQSGKQAEVKALITKFGAKKLTEIPTDKYPELMAEAEGLA